MPMNAKFKKSELLTALDAVFRQDFKTGIAHIAPQFEKIAMRIPSTTAINTYGFLGAFPKMREWVGERQIKQMQAQATQISNRKFESTVGIPRTDIEDDQVGLFSPMMQQMGQSAAELPDELVFGLFNKGESSLCYDGQNFFDNNHPYYLDVEGKTAGTPQSNITKGTDENALTWYLIDTKNVIKPLIFQERTQPEFETKFDPSQSDAVFMEDVYLWGSRYRCNAGFAFWQLAHKVKKTALTTENLMKVAEKMTWLKADGGAFLNIKPNVLLVPPSLEHIAREICDADVINGTTNILKGRFEVMVSPYIMESING